MRLPARQSGVALITVMLIVTIATLVAVAMADRQQLDIRRTGNLVFSDQALEYALGAEAWAMGLLEQDARDNAVDHLGEDWSTALAPIEVEGGAIRARIIDLSGRLNPNNLVTVGQQVDTSAQTRLLRLAQQLEDVPAELIPAVVDWIDVDLLASGANGAEDDYYSALEVPYRAANGPMADLSELRLLRGMTEEAYEALAPYLAPLPRGSTINVNTAPEQVLVAIGLDAVRAADIIQAREDSPFNQIEELVAHPVLQGLELDTTRLDVKSHYFLVEAEAVIAEVHFKLSSLLFREDTGRVSVLSRSQGAF
jgi:general secretion pathway protein K